MGPAVHYGRHGPSPNLRSPTLANASCQTETRSALSNSYDQPDAIGARQDWLFALIILQPAVVAVLATTYPWASPLTLLHDPFKISESHSPLHPLMGVLSSFGAIMLFCSSAIALFSATLATDRSSRRFLIYAGLYSSFLATDDFFGLHDRVLLEFSIRERYIELVYVLGQIIYIVAFYKILRRLNYFLLAASLMLFAISLAFDSRIMLIIQDVLFGSPLSPAAEEAWEDLPKLAGTVLWLWFHMLAARAIVGEGRQRSSLGPSHHGHPE